MAVSNPGGSRKESDTVGNSTELADIQVAENSTELVPRPPALPATINEHQAEPRRSAGPVRTTTGVIRVALSAISEVTTWSVGTVVGVTGTVVRGSMAGAPPRDILAEAGAAIRHSVRQALGVPTHTAERPEDDMCPPPPTLRERGAELLRLSARMHGEDRDHPAYARILTELAPDEARLLRYLYLDGAQPAIDIRIGRPLTPGSHRTDSGFTMLGDDAALRYPDRIGAYLANTRRLCLVEYTRGPLDNPARYQLLEAQPEVRRRLKRNAFGTKVTYRSIALTGFGSDFVRTCLPVPPLDQALG